MDGYVVVFKCKFGPDVCVMMSLRLIGRHDTTHTDIPKCVVRVIDDLLMFNPPWSISIVCLFIDRWRTRHNDEVPSKCLLYIEYAMGIVWW